MEGLSFCEQVTLYARSKVVFTHHGASLANGLFMRESSVMVEMNKQWLFSQGALHFAPTFYNAGYAAMFASSGVSYLGARVTFGRWPRGRRNGDGWPDGEGHVTWGT